MRPGQSSEGKTGLATTAGYLLGKVKGSYVDFTNVIKHVKLKLPPGLSMAMYFEIGNISFDAGIKRNRKAAVEWG